jgi:non-canonical purine NTP pyrophosphatase, rdgB/HAM1 family
MKIVLATTNAGKVRELSDMMSKANLDITVCGLMDYPDYCAPEENGETFGENARIKAVTASETLGEIVLADDSGLCVDALGGAPGVRSARFAGNGHNDDANIEKLLECMKDVPDGKRQARFVCSLCLAFPNGDFFVVEGDCPGTIARERRGTNGFGYDPVFLLPDGRMMAELSGMEKNLISHRGAAYKLVMPQLRALLKAPKQTL